MNRIALVFCVFAIVLQGPVFADEGQIINVNQNYQIAFTDLGNATLKQGDVIKVMITSDEFVYMQVLESSSILSKLGPIQSENFKTNYKDLQRVSVGNAVMKVTAALPEKTAPIASAPVPMAEKIVIVPTANQAEAVRLEKELKEAKMEISRLMEINKALQLQIQAVPVQDVRQSEDPAVLSQLRSKLENMNRLMSQNE